MSGTPDKSALIRHAACHVPCGSLNFTRDSSGLITGLTGDKELGATYDPDLQISSINHILPQPFAKGYTYDDNGNRLTSLTNTFIYDDLNRLTESTINDYTYDADGNLTMEKNKLTSETKKYYYDSENRMIKYEHLASDIAPIDITATYKYDIYGRRLQKNVNNVITNFFWENDTMTYELNEQYQPIRKYLTGMGIPKGDSITGYLAEPRYSDATDWSHIFWPEYNQPWYSYMKDQVGTVYQVYSLKTRSIAESRAYDSFGNLVNQSGMSKTPLGFHGKYYDVESGLNYFYHRYYNPAIGRFTSEDPIGFGSGGNFFTFVMGDPINAIDRFGLKANCVRKTDWLLTPGPFISDPNNLGELVNTTYHEDYKLSKEMNPLPIVSNIKNPRGQNSGQIIFICEYNLISILKKETYKKLREFEAIFKCTDSCSGNSWLEKRKDFFDFFYSKESNEQFVGNKKITFPPQLCPCGLLYSRDY